MTNPQNESPRSTERTEPSEFVRRAAERNSGLMRELLDLICHNKKWWLIPVIVALILIGIVVLLGTTAAAPFIYPLF